MRWLLTLSGLCLLILVGCANLKEPLEPREGSGDAVPRQPASPFFDATRPAHDDSPPSLADRSSEELEAFRDRHR